MTAAELRAEKIASHSTVLRALGGLGAEMMKDPHWHERLAKLEDDRLVQAKQGLGERLHNRQLGCVQPPGTCCNQGIYKGQVEHGAD